MASPRLAIVVPVYGHSVLASETLHSALAQTAEFGIHIIVVNDGCPREETHHVLSAIAMSHPDRVTYLRKPNGGLSSARNAGIRHVLEHMPSVEALFMLDADNRLRPRSLATAMAELDKHPKAGWIYPSIDMFGIYARCDYGGPYSRLIHSEINICEAGSLIRREVFEAGVLFDETFKLGFEDWHFFLSAGDAGFYGVNLENFGFFYRKRPESMLADSNRSREALRARIRHEHPDLFVPANRLRLEHEEAPRYAIWLSDTDEVALVTDPGMPGRVVSRAELVRDFWARLSAPMQNRVPPYLVVTTRRVYTALQDAKILNWVLWRLELSAGDRNMACGMLEAPFENGEVAAADALYFDVRDGLRHAASIWLVGSGVMEDLVSVPMPPDLTNPAFEVPECAGLRLRVDLPEAAGPERDPLHAAVSAFYQAPWRAVGIKRWRWRQPSIKYRGKEHLILRMMFEDEPVLPRLKGEGREIGVVAESTEAPGLIERLQDLQDARSNGARVLLCVMTNRATLTGDGLHDMVDAVVMLDYENFTLVEGKGLGDPDVYNGTLMPRVVQQVLDDRVMALLCGLDELHNVGYIGALRITGALRRFGIRTVMYLPDVAHPVRDDLVTLTLAYEHAHDAISVVSREMESYLRARGLPGSKIETKPDAG